MTPKQQIRIVAWLSVSVWLMACPPEVAEPAVGSEGGRCLSNGSCDADLSCLSNRCVRLPEDASVGDVVTGDALNTDRAIPDGSCASIDGGIGSCTPVCGSDGNCPLDILFVIDNSVSMFEEQDKLASAVSTLIMQLDMRNNQYHIGVISMDMNDCDSSNSTSPRPTVPQRGCLQSSQQDPDLTVLTWQTAGAATKLDTIIRNLGTSGTPYEKGLGAVAHFLTPGHSVPAVDACDKVRDCSGDLDAFMRQQAHNALNETVDTKLLLIFLTDEDDCTHGGQINEAVTGNTALCYTSSESLSPVADIIANVKQRKRSPALISVATIAGLVQEGASFVASGCTLVDGSASDDCHLSMGNSVATCDQCVNNEPLCSCHPALICSDGTSYADANCCQADPASRYLQFAQGFASHIEASLCSDSYNSAVTRIVEEAL